MYVTEETWLLVERVLGSSHHSPPRRQAPISYPESSGSLVSGLVARRDSGEMEFFPQKSGVPVVVRMLSFIKTEVNVSREVGMLDESLDGNQKS